MIDLIFRNAEIYDGDGKAPCQADVLIQGDKIADIGHFPGASAVRVIDAKGLCLFPGFIDVHTHSDAALLRNPAREDAVRQGVTTEVTGSCGIGVAPISAGRDDYLKTVRGILGDMSDAPPFSDLDGYITAVGEAGVNYAVQLGHSPLRIEAVGNGDAEMTPEQMDALLKLEETALASGFCALSTGLCYYPASFSATDELTRLSALAAKHGAPLTIHLRSVRNRHFPGGMDPEGEAIEIAQKSGVHLHFSHFRTNVATVGKVEERLARLEDGIRQGLAITADFYPYPVGCGYVAVNLPSWVMAGGFDDIMARLGEPGTRRRIADEMESGNPALANGVFVHAPAHPGYLGRSYTEVARAGGERVADMLVRFLFEEGLNGAYIPDDPITGEMTRLFEQDFAALLGKPFYMVGSDTLPGHTRPHPRSFFTFPKILRIAREHDVPLSAVANRAAAMPADVFGLKNRGRVKRGNYADITVFDAGAVGEASAQAMAGIRYVMVNGKLRLDGGRITEELPGRALRRGL